MSQTQTRMVPIKGVHHLAYRCRDAEETRHFYEDILGLEFKAALALDKEPGSGKERPFVHLFFKMIDGNFIAFFDDPKGAENFNFKPQDGFDAHVAMEVEGEEDMKTAMARLDAHEVVHFGPIDHGFCHSLYFWDPSGVALEITYKDENHDGILADEQAASRKVIRDWTAAKKARAAAD